MKRGLFYPHRRRLRPSRWVRVLQAPRAALVLPAAALLLYSCDPPASPSSAAAEVRTISGLPNMAEIERRLNDQYKESAESTDGVSFALDKSGISPDGKTVVRAVITYAESKLLEMEIGEEEHDIKTITITREVDGKTIPTTVEYKDDGGTTRKTITSHYVHASNNARQSLEGGPTLDISGEERDGADNLLRTFTATERTQGGTTTLRTTYLRPDKEGFTEIVTTENGRLTEKVVTYPDKEAAAKKIKTQTITYEKSAAAMFYPNRKEPTLTVTTTLPADNVTLVVYEDGGGKKTKSIKTTRNTDGSTLAVHKDGEENETLRVETRSDKSTITTKTTAGVTTKELVIHPSVTAIEDKAFQNSGLTSLTMGNNLRTIGKQAFENNKLTKLTIGNGVKTIGRGAFRNNKLSSVKIGNSLQRIEPEVFRGNQLTRLTVPPSVTAIESHAFYGNKLYSVKIPPSVTAIGEAAFMKNKLTVLTIPPSVTVIDYSAFLQNELRVVSIPASIDSIKRTAFARNYTLRMVIITGTGPITAKAFTYSDLTDAEIETKGVFEPSNSSDIMLIIGEGVTSIGNSAFAASRLTEVVIGESVKTIGRNAFTRNKLDTVVIPSSVTAIGEAAFSYNQLTRLTIPSSVTAIGEAAFSNNKLTSVTLPKALSKARETAFNGNPTDLQFRDE